MSTGVSKELADSRSHSIDRINYQLFFNIPDDRSEEIGGQLKLQFILRSNDQELVLDYKGSKSSIKSLKINGSNSEVFSQNGHLLFLPDQLKEGQNEVEIEFITDGSALNRREDHLYSLFVPNHASSIFPCFDQPDLKARFKLGLSIPDSWEVLSNGSIISDETIDDKRVVSFSATEPISTYLFSFVAGVFSRKVVIDQGLSIEILYRDSEDSLRAQNLEGITRIHSLAIHWLEKYTGVEYPFEKFGIALIPGFQFGGMEHPGAIDYRASLLLLENASTLDDKLRRAKLIAHETTHMWFGNYVTMKWFDDVWMKEVFANYLADKIVAEMFPEVNQDLNFLYDHYPKSYEIDRSAGAVPIRQNLDNLDNAANMYSSITYHKAPIMMRQLEERIGENVLKAALGDYLESFAFGCADWEDLVTILERVSGERLDQFNESWVYQAGMPFFELKWVRTDVLNEYDLVQHDLEGLDRVWPQFSDIVFTSDLDRHVKRELVLDKHHYILPQGQSTKEPKSILLNTSGKGYGIFSHGVGYERSEFLFHQARVDLSRIHGDLQRGAAYINLHEYLLHKGFHPQLYFQFLQNYLLEEKNEVIIEYLIGLLEQVYLRFFTHDMRLSNASNLEKLLLSKMKSVEDTELKHTLFNAYINLAISEKALASLNSYWRTSDAPEGITISKRQMESLAMNIALKSEDSNGIIDRQLKKMTDKDRIKRMKFIQPSLSKNHMVLDSLFNVLENPENRKREPWVLSAMGYLHHPFRNESSLKYLKPSLEMISEVDSTGNIFFSKGWIAKVLQGYNSPEASSMVESFIETNNLSGHLQNKLLQSSDLLFRSQKNLQVYFDE